jgi:hypothetical protein
MTDLLPVGDYAFANWGRWLVLCSDPFCFNAMQIYPGQDLVTCTECRTTLGPLIWPADPEAVETVLLMRPDFRTRNWHPGETLEDLLVENTAHGIDPPDTGQKVLTRSVDGVLVGGSVGLLLPSDIRRHQIEAAVYPK